MRGNRHREYRVGDAVDVGIKGRNDRIVFKIGRGRLDPPGWKPEGQKEPGTLILHPIEAFPLTAGDIKP